MGRWKGKFSASRGCLLVHGEDEYPGINVMQIAWRLNTDYDAYEARIAELEAELKTESQWLAEYQKQRDEAAGRLARIAALVRPVPVADLVEAGTEAPALLAERQRKIRAILEEDR